jgi:DNA-binding beta-propeller fold protein YncE
VTSIVAPGRFPTLLYMADMLNHRILLWDFQNNISKIISGESNIFGSDSTHLYNPSGITLDERTNTLYIADKSNNRIQKSNLSEASSSITVAGWGQLNNPYAVQLDPSGINMFIADTLNHRILLWLNGATQGRIIAGNGSIGNSVFQLNSPTQIRFDSNYNLYVVDTNNCRIQRFDLISNGC